MVGRTSVAIERLVGGGPRYPRRVLRLLTDSADPPVLDTALSTALLRGVATGEEPPTLRLYVPRRIVAFGRQDAARPGFRTAVDAAADAGYAPVERLAGGRAAVFHEGTLAFAWSTPESHPRKTIADRFRAISGIVAEALGALGVDARIGEVPGEYCPGGFSVNARGRRKLMGVGQRLIRGAAHVGGVVVAERADLVNVPLVLAYAALGYEWDPSATGSVFDEVGADVDVVRTALLESFERAGHDLVPTALDPAIVAAAAGLSSLHEIA
jgi:octanoyl-[GcvH]:protein N-octanoyltransferase